MLMNKGTESTDDFFSKIKKAENSLPGGAVKMPDFRAQEDEKEGEKFIEYLEEHGAKDGTYTIAQLNKLSRKFDVGSHYAQSRLKQLDWHVI